MTNLKLKIKKLEGIGNWKVRLLRSVEIGNSPRSGGQSLFEVVFALAIAAIVLIGVVSLAASSVRNSTFARNDALATRHTQEASEWLREQRDTNPWSAVIGYASVAGTTYCLTDVNVGLTGLPCSVIPGTIFTRQVILREISADEIEATIIVDWTDAKGTHEVRTVTHYTNWRIP